MTAIFIKTAGVSFCTVWVFARWLVGQTEVTPRPAAASTNQQDYYTYARIIGCDGFFDLNQ